MRTKAVPSHWPPTISYIYAPSYAASLSPILITDLRGSKPSLYTPPCKGRVSIRCIKDNDHPASGQYGLFAARQIEANTHIVDYLGEVHSDERPWSDYDLSLLRLQDGVNVGIDASTMGNEGRFVNDYRGVKTKPNALFKEGRTPSGELRISIWSASSKIRKGDEVLVSYGKSWWRSRTVMGKERSIAHVGEELGRFIRRLTGPLVLVTNFFEYKLDEAVGWDILYVNSL